MSKIPIYKKCLKCKKNFSWNPDVGKINCPHCGKLCTPATTVDITFKELKKHL